MLRWYVDMRVMEVDMGSKRILKRCSETLGLCVERADSKNVLVEGILTSKVKVHQMLDKVHGVYHPDDYYKWRGVVVYEGKRMASKEVVEDMRDEYDNECTEVYQSA
jgi:hypothetical protein